MLSLQQLKDEVSKLFQSDYLQQELQRFRKELNDFEIYKKIQEPTLKHVQQLEKQYKVLSQKMAQKQVELDKEFNSTVKMLKKRRTEAEKHLKDLQKKALDQKNAMEKRIRQQMGALGLVKEGTTARKVKKKTQKKASTTAKKIKKKTS